MGTLYQSSCYLTAVGDWEAENNVVLCDHEHRRFDICLGNLCLQVYLASVQSTAQTLCFGSIVDETDDIDDRDLKCLRYLPLMSLKLP